MEQWKMINFKDLKTTQKEEVGESLVNKYLEAKGFIIYTPITNGSHAFDRLAIKDNKLLLIAEIKSKAKRLKYPDTGINIKHYNIYKDIQEKHNLNVFIFFVDEEMSKIYGGWLKDLEKEQEISHNGFNLKYPIKWNDIIYFPMKNTKTICDITKEDTDILKNFTAKNSKYIIT